MRISVEETDPGYEAWREIVNSGGHIQVFLNEKELMFEALIMADEEKGLVTMLTNNICYGDRLCRKYIAGKNVRIVVTYYNKVGEPI